MNKLLLLLVCAVAFASGSQVCAENSAISNWWTQFQAVVAHEDKEALSGMIHFPLEWEDLELRSIKSKDEFLKRFAEVFTKEIKKQIAAGKPEPEKDGGFSLNWKGRGKRAANSYCIAFKTASGGTFTIEGLFEGPRD